MPGRDNEGNGGNTACRHRHDKCPSGSACLPKHNADHGEDGHYCVEASPSVASFANEHDGGDSCAGPVNNGDPCICPLPQFAEAGDGRQNRPKEECAEGHTFACSSKGACNHVEVSE